MGKITEYRKETLIDILKVMAIGKENGLNLEDLSCLLAVKSRAITRMIKEINEDNKDILIISSKKYGIYIPENEDEAVEYVNEIYKSAKKKMKKYQQYKLKISVEGQQNIEGEIEKIW